MKRLSFCLMLMFATCASLGAEGLLSLEDAVGMALERNPRLIEAELAWRQAQAERLLADSVEDSVLRLGVGYEDSGLPPASFPGARGIQTGLAEASFLRRVGTGADVGVVGDSQRNFFDTGREGETPVYRSSVGVRLSQPLMQNRGGRTDRLRRAVADRGVESAFLMLQRERERVSAEVQDAWWVAVAERGYADTLVRAEQRRQELVEDLRGKVEDGLVDVTELYAAEAALASYRLEVLRVSRLADRAEDEVRRLAFVDRRGWGQVTFRVEVPEAPGEAWGAVSDWDLFAHAETSRWDVRAIQRLIDQAEATMLLAEDEGRMDVRVEGEYRRGDSGEGWSDSLGLDREVWAAGLRAEIPLGNRRTEARVIQARLEREFYMSEAESLLQVVFWECRNALGDFRAAQEAVGMAERALMLQKRKRDGERVRFDRGQSSARFLIEDEDAVDFAERQLLAARLEARRAWIQVKLASGRLLAAREEGM
ncbi:MAG TPA: TolC family protein [Kiritimatiellia bacterium]|nr:TolC family protein [Kiritimatiellia bacterium]